MNRHCLLVGHCMMNEWRNEVTISVYKVTRLIKSIYDLSSPINYLRMNIVDSLLPCAINNFNYLYDFGGLLMNFTVLLTTESRVYQ